MKSGNVKFRRAAAAACATLAVSTATVLAGCTIYASGTDEWDSDPPSSSMHESRPPPRSVVPVSLIGREVRVHLREPDSPVEGTIRDMGEWVRLERNGSTMFIPRDHIRYVEAIVPPATQP